MENLFVNILRGFVTNSLSIILVFSLVEFKYSKKTTVFVGILIDLVVTMLTSYFYIFYDITTGARFHLLMWIVTAVTCKFLFTDSVMKWLFNLVTVMNVLFFIIVMSYILSRQLPYPMYTHIIIRIILFVIFITLFKKYLYPRYRQVVDRWQLFLAVAIGSMLNFAYIIMTSQNLAETISENFIPILLLEGLIFLAYGTMIWAFGSIIREYKFYTEKEQLRLHEELVYTQLKTYEKFVEESKRHRHDLRHHNQMVMQYLKCGNISGAEEYLQSYDTSLTARITIHFCENYIANAVLCLYAQKAYANNVSFIVDAEIPENIVVTQPELGSMLSNILENAMASCQKTKDTSQFISFVAVMADDSLKIELQNSVRDEVKFKSGLPLSTKENGGIGTRSVLYTVERYHGMLHFRQDEDIFTTQIILPL